MPQNFNYFCLQMHTIQAFTLMGQETNEQLEAQAGKVLPSKIFGEFLSNFLFRSPESRLSCNSNRSPNRNVNGTAREVYATIHDQDDRQVTTSLIAFQQPTSVRHSSSPNLDCGPSRVIHASLLERQDSSFTNEPVSGYNKQGSVAIHECSHRILASNGKAEIITITHTDVSL